MGRSVLRSVDVVITGLLVAGLLQEAMPGPRVPQARLGFWEGVRRGANCANASVEPEYWRAAARAGIAWVRLIPDSWEAAERDFLLGDADAYVRIPPADLARLRSVLDDAHAAGVRVVLGMFSQPGARWVQLNDGVQDDRLWRDRAYHAQAAAFWRDVARELRHHPALVGYNPLNEPHPERSFDIHVASSEKAKRWFEKTRGTAADVNVFNREVVAAIRAVDPSMPILLDGPFYAAPSGLRYVEPLEDPAVLYAVHFYGVWTWSTYRVNQGRFAYPERMPAGEGDDTVVWTREDLRERLAVIEDWRARHGIPLRRLVVSEFGVDRRVEGAEAFLRDTIDVLEELEVHWAFYAFRGDGAWGGMDYELGTGRLGGAYWQAVENGADPETLKKRHDNPLWRVLQEGLRRP